MDTEPSMGSLLTSNEKDKVQDDIRPWNKDSDIQRGVEEEVLTRNRARFWSNVIQIKQTPANFCLFEPRGHAPSCVTEETHKAIEEELKSTPAQHRKLYAPLAWLDMRLTELGVIRAERDKAAETMRSRLSKVEDKATDKEVVKAWDYAIGIQNAYAVWLYQLRQASSGSMETDEPSDTESVKEEEEQKPEVEKSGKDEKEVQGVRSPNGSSKKRRREEVSKPVAPTRRLPKRAKLVTLSSVSDSDSDADEWGVKSSHKKKAQEAKPPATPKKSSSSSSSSSSKSSPSKDKNTTETKKAKESKEEVMDSESDSESSSEDSEDDDYLPLAPEDGDLPSELDEEEENEDEEEEEEDESSE